MSRGTILVVEQDPAHASAYETLLAGEGYRVVRAANAEEGLRLLRERPCDVVVAGALPAPGGGLPFLEAVKEAHPRQDVVVVTRRESPRAGAEALRRGAAGCIAGPVDGEELLLLLRGVIERQSRSRELSRLVGENVLFYEQLRVHRRALELLALLDIDRVIDHFLDLLIAETAAVWAALFFYNRDEDTFSFAARRGICDVRVERPGAAFRGEALREQFFRGRALREDREGGQYAENDPRGGHRFRLPLLVRGGMTGMAVVGPRRDEAPHGGCLIGVARVIAESGAVALENARRYALEASRDVHDPLTGTCSPVFFRQAGAKEVSIAHRYGRSISAVVVQLDTYPSVKAALKESQARQLLREFAAKIQEVARETDIVAMIEEGLFGVIVPETDYYGALMLIKRLRGALRGTVFRIDLAREIGIRCSMGAASHPRDGEQLVTILRRARERLAQDRASAVRALGLGGRSFWDAFDLLLDLERGPRPLPAGAFLTLSTPEFDRVRNLLLEEAGRLGDARGVLYIGNQVVEATAPDSPGFPRLAGSKASVFCLGARGQGGWSHPEITPVYLADERIATGRFLLCVTEHGYYTCLCRPEGPGSWRVFHSADPFLALELVSKLQERYLLQQRIG